MAALEERVSFLEGQMVLVPQTVAALRDEVHGLRGEINGFRGELNGFRNELNGLRGEMVTGMNRLDDRMSRQFYWTLGVQTTMFVVTLGAILGVFYIRG